MEQKEHVHWLKYPIQEIVYGPHRFGMGCCRIVDGVEKDYWLDLERSTEREINKYNAWLAANGYKPIPVEAKQ